MVAPPVAALAVTPPVSGPPTSKAMVAIATATKAALRPAIVATTIRRPATSRVSVIVKRPYLGSGGGGYKNADEVA